MDEAISALALGPLEPEERERMERIGDHVYDKYRPRLPDLGDAKVARGARVME